MFLLCVYLLLVSVSFENLDPSKKGCNTFFICLKESSVMSNNTISYVDGVSVEKPGAGAVPTPSVTTEVTLSQNEYNRYLRQIVQVYSYSKETNMAVPYMPSPTVVGRGSGFSIPGPDGGGDRYLLTCAHVVEKAHPQNGVKIMIPGQSKEQILVSVFALLPEVDLAVLKLSGAGSSSSTQSPALTLGDDKTLVLPSKVTVVGYPLGMDQLKVLECTYNGRQVGLQVDGAINPGNSGGPVLYKNEVVGVISSGINPMMANNVSFAIPISYYEAAKASIFDPNRKQIVLHKPGLGMMYHPINDDMIKSVSSGCSAAVALQWVAQNSPLRDAGFRDGDLLCKITVGEDVYDIDRKGDVKVPWHLERLPITELLNRIPYNDPIHVQGWSANGKEAIDGQVRLNYRPRNGFLKVFPHYEQVDHETFGGLTVMPMRLNHLEVFPPLIFRLSLRDREKPQILVTSVLPGTPISDLETLQAGTTIVKVNNKPVTTMQEYREALSHPLLGAHGKRYISLEGEQGEHVVADLDVLLTNETAVAVQHGYKVSKLVDTLGTVNGNAPTTLNGVRPEKGPG